jgi:hypothetical protein
MNSPAATLGRRAAIVSILSTTYFLAAAITTQIIMTQYNVMSDYISDYAVGPWGWIYGSAFWASCIGCIALATSLTYLIPSKAMSRIGVILLTILGITYAVDSIFPTDILPPGAPPTTVVGTIHFVDAFFGWVVFTVSAILLSSRLMQDAYWRPWRTVLLSLAWLSALLLVVLVAVVLSKEPFGGLAEKAFILDRNVWTLLIGLLVFNSPAALETVVPALPTQKFAK